MVPVKSEKSRPLHQINEISTSRVFKYISIVFLVTVGIILHQLCFH